MRLSFLKNLTGKLPLSWQMEIRRHMYQRQIRRDAFITDEPEYELLSSLLADADWAIDVGANIGHYTKRMSELVGEQGRVIAFEPVADTFSLLAANTRLYQHQNVSLFNAAVSDKSGITRILVPQFANGHPNYYEATVVSNGDGFTVMTLAIDSLDIPATVKLVKIDAEGHELAVLKGMRQLLMRDKPVLIVEVSGEAVHQLLADLGYTRETLPNSPNHIYRA
jgi:FkbM family methyltransferase